MLQIIMLVVGIIVLAKGKITFSRNRVAVGGPAYAAGIIMLLPLPLALLTGVVLGIRAAQQGRDLDDMKATLTVMELVLTLGCFILAMVISYSFGVGPNDHSRRHEEDQWDDIDGDRRRPRDDEDDGWRRRRDPYDDDEPRPTRGRHHDDEPNRPRERDDRYR